MEFRIEKRIIAVLGGLLMSSALLAQSSFQYQARRQQSRPPHIKAGAIGTLTIDNLGISFQEKNGKRSHERHWVYQDVKQLKIAPKSLSVLTYKDNRWKFGAGRQYNFNLISGETFEDAYNVLKSRLDQRFVAEIADGRVQVLWEIPAKHLRRFGGDEGLLQIGPDQIVYNSAKGDQTRSWRYEDIDNINSSGPFELTITTFERAILDYGSRKQFSFELKQPLDETRYNDLWLRLNQSKGLKVLTSYRQAEPAIQSGKE